MTKPAGITLITATLVGHVWSDNLEELNHQHLVTFLRYLNSKSESACIIFLVVMLVNFSDDSSSSNRNYMIDSKYANGDIYICFADGYFRGKFVLAEKKTFI